MQPSTAAMEVGSEPVPRSKTRVLTLGHLDRGTRAARRARALAADFATELGGALSVAQRAAVEQAATLTALSEDAASRRLGGAVDVSLEDVVRLGRLA